MKKSNVARYLDAYEENKTNGKSWYQTLRDHHLRLDYEKLDLEGLQDKVKTRRVQMLIKLTNIIRKDTDSVYIRVCERFAKRYIAQRPNCAELPLFRIEEVNDAELIRELERRHIHLGTDGKWHKFKEVVIRKMEDSIIEL